MPSNSVVLKDFMAKVPGAHLSIIAENSLYARVLLAFFFVICCLFITPLQHIDLTWYLQFSYLRFVLRWEAICLHPLY